MQLTAPIHWLLTKMIGGLSRCRNLIDSRRERKEKQRFEAAFNGESSFLHKVNEEVTMRLYRDSKLSRMIYDGFEQEETAYMQTVLKPGDTMLDIGANVGLFTMLAAQQVGATGRVLSFEPSPTTFLRLEENVAINDFNHVQCFNIGLSDKSGTLDFYTSQSGHDAWDSFAVDARGRLGNSVSVPVQALDEIVQTHTITRIDFIKIDVEGWEKFVIMGGTECLTTQSPIVMVEFTDENTFNAGYRTLDIYEAMESLGYRWFMIEDGALVPDAPQMYYPYKNLVAVKA